MSRPVPRISKPVLSDEEVVAAMTADGASQDDIDAAMAQRRAARETAQAQYDTKPPTTRYREPQQ